MIDGILAFFSAFNPIVFGIIVSVGAIIMVRRPAPAPVARSSSIRHRDGTHVSARRTQ